MGLLLVKLWVHESKLLSNTTHPIPVPPSLPWGQNSLLWTILACGVWEFNPYNPLPLESGQER